MAISTALKTLDADLHTVGGIARAGMDDTYAVGPPDRVFPAVLRFKATLREEFGLELREDKSAYYIDPAGREGYDDDHPEGPPFDALAGAVPPGSITGADGSVHYGIKVFGIPVGSRGYV